MRELTKEELDSVLGEYFVCPFCKCEEWIEGGVGGMAQNVFCGNEECQAGFNVTPIKEMGGQLIRKPKVAA